MNAWPYIYVFFSQYWTSDKAYLICCKTEQRSRRWEEKMSIMIQCFVHHHHAIERDDFTFIRKLDQGALGMSDPWGPLKLALQPNSVFSIICRLSNFYFCAHEQHDHHDPHEHHGPLTATTIMTTMTTISTMTTMSMMIMVTMRKLEVVHKEVGGCTQGSWRLSQRKQRGNMCTAKECSVELLKWLLICSQDLEVWWGKSGDGRSLVDRSEWWIMSDSITQSVRYVGIKLLGQLKMRS